MPRQRLGSRSSALARGVARALAFLFAAAVAYGGLVVLLLAVGFSRSDVNAISGYRVAYDALAGLSARDIDGTTRLIAAIAGLLGSLVFGLLLWRVLPRPYLARSDVQIADDDHGRVNVSPRAIERAVEGAALGVPAVVDARGRLAADRVTVEITAAGADTVLTTLADVQERARASLRTHELPDLPIDCTLISLQRKNKRELA